MPSFLPELMRRASGALAVAALAATMAVPQAQAAAVSGQGTWETTLQGRDLDGDASTFEAYYDTDLKITWLADAGYAKTSGYDADGHLNWDAAKTWAAQLNINGVTGWRLPNVKPVNGSSFQYSYSPAGNTDNGYNITSTQSELAHLYYVTLGEKGFIDTSGTVDTSGAFTYDANYDRRNTGPFRNVQRGYYWSGVEYTPHTYFVWYFSTYHGYQELSSKDVHFSAWAVRSGDVGAAPEPQAYAIALAGLAAVLMVRGRRHR